MKSTTLLDVVEETNNANITKDDHERIDRIAANLIIQEENNHQKMIELVKEKFDKKKNKKKKMNESQRRKKVELTDSTTGRISFSMLQRIHINEVIEEIKARGHAPAGATVAIRKLTDILRKAVQLKDGEQYDRAFHPRTNSLQIMFQYSTKFQQ